MDTLQQLIDQKYISVQKHPNADLYIYNYTNKAQFDKMWTEETLTCRGLIMDKNGKVVARPFRKFFNLEECQELPNEPFEVFDKWDGSLGILYWIGSVPYLATRGSFVSEQALKGSEMLQQLYADNSSLVFNANYTYLFEIIYPQNRIVVDYKGLEDLVLLAIIDTATGKDLSHEKLLELHGKDFVIAKRYDGIRDLKKIKEAFSCDNNEGFVIRFQSGLRIKIKFDEYVRLHRLVTGINARHIWENLKEGKGIDELIDHVPDEFYEWVISTTQKLNDHYKTIENHCLESLELSKPFASRKDKAICIQGNSKHPGVVFRMLDNRDYSQAIWNIIKPAHEIPFKREI